MNTPVTVSLPSALCSATKCKLMHTDYWMSALLAAGLEVSVTCKAEAAGSCLCHAAVHDVVHRGRVVVPERRLRKVAHRMLHGKQHNSVNFEACVTDRELCAAEVGCQGGLVCRRIPSGILKTGTCVASCQGHVAPHAAGRQPPTVNKSGLR